MYIDGCNENVKGPSSVNNFDYLIKINSGRGLAYVAHILWWCVLVLDTHPILDGTCRILLFMYLKFAMCPKCIGDILLMCPRLGR